MLSRVSGSGLPVGFGFGGSQGCRDMERITVDERKPEGNLKGNLREHYTTVAQRVHKHYYYGIRP